MREEAPENYSYEQYDPRYWGRPRQNPAPTHSEDNGDHEMFAHRRRSFFDRFQSLGGLRMREHYGDDTTSGHSRFHDFVLQYFGLLVSIGIGAGVAWILAKILKLAVPTKWSFLYGLLNIIDTVGWWVMIICAIILILGWILGHVYKLMEWAKSRY